MTTPLEAWFDLGSHVTLVVQLVTLALLLNGFRHARAKRYDNHERMMLAAVGLGGAAFFSWMLVSIITYFDLIISNLTAPGVVVTIIHVSIGSVAGAFAIYVVLNMRLRVPRFMRMRNRRRTMRITFTLWLSALIFGFAFYSYYFILNAPI